MKESHSFVACSHPLSGVLPGWGSLSLLSSSFCTQCMFKQLHSEICQRADVAENCLRLRKCHVGRCGEDLGSCTEPPHRGTRSSGCWDTAPCEDQTYYSLSAKTYSWVSASIALGFVFHCLCAQHDYAWQMPNATIPPIWHKLLIFCCPGFLNSAHFEGDKCLFWVQWRKDWGCGRGMGVKESIQCR